MVRFGGTCWKRARTAVCLTLAVAMLSSCSMTRIDEIRPEVNREQAMLIDPDTFAQIVGSEHGNWAEGNSSVSGGSTGGNRLPGMSTGGATEGVVPGDGVLAEEEEYTEVVLKEQVVSATSYSRYLSEKVVAPITEMCDDMNPKPYDKLYFRVVHRGYDPVGIDESNVMTPSTSPYDFKFIGGITRVSGYTVSEFAYNYLMTVSGNSTRVANKRRDVIAAVNKSGLGTKTSWLSAGDSTRLSSPIKEMWGNERLGAEESLSAYLQAVNKSAIGTLPDLTLYISRGTYGRTSVTLNQTTGNLRYVDNVSKYALSTIISAPNQYPDHKPIRTLSGFDYDEHCLLWYNIDGWSSTIAIIGCDESTTLPELFGEDYDSIHDIIANISKNSDWAQICAMEGMEDASTISAGARGTE